MMKKCSKCKVEKPLDQFRFKNKKLGKRHANCKECNQAACKKYYWKDPEAQRKRVKECMSDETNRRNRRKNNAKYMVAYRKKYPDKVKKAIREHYLKNKEAYVHRARLRRSKEFGWVNSAFLKKVKEQFSHKCFCCGGDGMGHPLHYDHHIPLRDGGQLIPGNITLLCSLCNNLKKNVLIYTEDQLAILRDHHEEQKRWLSPKDFSVERVSEASVYRGMLELFHYTGTVPGASYKYVLKYHTKIVGVCLFSKPSRQSIKADLELSRFFLMDGTPRNTASYFIGSVLRKLKEEGFSGKVITFSDPTEGHSGSIYKATNWKFIGYTSKNYHYETEDGLRVHKRQVWNRAKEHGLSEAEEANLEGLKKVEELPKHKYHFEV